ncbi:MAG: hypothetical protein AAFY88_12775 [Acidobacteriota bacterium]
MTELSKDSTSEHSRETQETPQKPLPTSISDTPSDEFAQLMALVLANDDLTTKDKKTLLREIRKASPLRNRSLYLVVVIALGTVVLITVIWGFALVSLAEPAKATLPAGLVALGSTALGALAGLLAPSPRSG